MPGSLIIIVPASVGSIAWERYSGARSFVLCTVLGQLQVLYPPVLRYVILLDHRLAKANCNSPLTGRLPSAGPGVCAVMCAVKRRMCRILGGVRQCLATEMSGHQKPPTRQLCFSANLFLFSRQYKKMRLVRVNHFGTGFIEIGISHVDFCWL